MSAMWKSIAEVPEKWRAGLIIQVESAAVETRAKKVVQHIYDPTQLFGASAEIIRRIRAAVKFSPFEWRSDEAVQYMPCYDEALQLLEYRASLTKIVGSRVSVNDEVVRLCLSIQREVFHPLTISAVELDEEHWIKGQFVNSVHGTIDWEHASSMWRCGPRNEEGKRVGYDAFGIEFDYQAAKAFGWRTTTDILEQGNVNKPIRIDRWKEEQMTTAIMDYCRDTQSGDRDKAWDDKFKAMQPETGWGNTDFRNHWSKARETVGQAGRQSGERSKAGGKSAR